ncbi:response regulator [Desulfitobacterium metallireducens]|uniref:Transcriptional regulatory protein n=1 Tax=Desulfitobacterium metallireducens DSM 15288 TaxID=871968 RepID=W0E9I6_9FIRM|nr:response regulator [Desulfitobacterium metallireducens]AHF06168.1 transcriptional regulator [Desulfitobacterium metallireducens DSM 15288]
MINVLIIEDDPMVAEFNKRYLEQVEGFALQGIAASADEAIEILKREDIDLILLDIYMPRLSGLELLSKIRKKGKGVDVIVVSAASDSYSIKKALQYGAVDYLIKPFEFERFSEALTTYRKRAMLMQDDQEKLSQVDLDKQIFHKDAPGKPGELPKGLTRDTLKLVWEHIQRTDNEAFSTEEIAQRVGISRVSMRKYLSFLGQIGILKTEVLYGSVGRPVYKHRYISSKRKAIHIYLEAAR